jgi:hypothetical protein
MIGVVGGWVMVVFASTWTACTVLFVLYNQRRTLKENASCFRKGKRFEMSRPLTITA